MALRRWVEPIVQLNVPGVLIRMPSTETTADPVGLESIVTRTQLVGSEVAVAEESVVLVLVGSALVKFEVEE